MALTAEVRGGAELQPASPDALRGLKLRATFGRLNVILWREPH
jgi:hypothetical protein